MAIMRSIVLLLVLVAVSNAQLLGGSKACPTSQWWKPSPGTTWQWQISGTVSTSVDVQMYDIDLFDASPSLISQLHSQGRVVICYFSTQYEDWRPDASQFTSNVIGSPLDGWQGENWVDIRSSVVRDIMTRRLQIAVDKGCDGVEPDNVDGYNNGNGLGLTANDQLDFNKFLANAAHVKGLSIGLKNDLDQASALQTYFDWALNEQCYEYSECDLLKVFINAGKAVFNTEYKGTGASVCPYMVNNKFSSLVKSLDLDASIKAQCCTYASGGCATKPAYTCAGSSATTAPTTTTRAPTTTTTTTTTTKPPSTTTTTTKIPSTTTKTPSTTTRPPTTTTRVPTTTTRAPASTTQAPTTTTTTTTPLTGTTRLCGSGKWWKPAVGTTWQWQLTGTIDTSIDVQVYDIDLFDSSATLISQLHSKGRAVICYFSTQYEDWRSDASQFTANVLGSPLDGWQGERWVDIRSTVVRNIMKSRMQLAVQKGCDGVEPDNVDGYSNSNGLGLTANDQLDFNRFLATTGHSLGLSVGLKNDLDQAATLQANFDWALNEQCAEYSECTMLNTFINAGKAVFNAEYKGTGASVCPGMVSRKFSSIVKKLNLDASITAQCCTYASGGCATKPQYTCVSSSTRRALDEQEDLSVIEVAIGSGAHTQLPALAGALSVAAVFFMLL